MQHRIICKWLVVLSVTLIFQLIHRVAKATSAHSSVESTARSLSDALIQFSAATDLIVWFEDGISPKHLRAPRCRAVSPRTTGFEHCLRVPTSRIYPGRAWVTTSIAPCRIRRVREVPEVTVTARQNTDA